MRVTLNLDDDAIEALKRFSEEQSMSRSCAASILIHRGSHRPMVTEIVNGFHVIVTPPGSPKVTLEHIKEVEEQMDLEYIRRFDKRKKR